MIKAVFFDLDNTLCASDTAWNIAVRDTFQILRQHYPDVSKAFLLRTWESVLQELFQGLDGGKCSMAEVRDLRFYRLFEKLNLSQDKLTEELSNSLCQRYIASLRLYEDVEVLDRLYAFHVGIITNGAHDEHTDSQFSKVRNFGLSKRIQSLTISDEIGVRKPNAEIFKIACDRAGVLPREAIMVGDSIQNDIVGANKIDMTSVLIDRNSDAVTTEIAVEQADYTIPNLYDVLRCLKQD